MFKENLVSGLSWLPLISRIVLAKNPRDPLDVSPLSVFFFLFLSTKNTILKKYDGRFKDIFQEIYEK